MCIFNSPSAPEAPKPIIQDTAPEPTAPELGGEDNERKKRRAASQGIRSLRTDVGGVRRDKNAAGGIAVRRIRN